MSVKQLGHDLAVFGDPIDVGALEQIKTCLQHPQAVKGALMADHHLGYSMPIGGVVAYDNAISPTGVGFDIGCGNKAVRTNIRIRDLVTPESAKDAGDHFTPVKAIMREIKKTVAFGVGRSRADQMNEELLSHPLWGEPVWAELDKHFGDDLWAKARKQLGTVGSGNHYVDLLVDEEGFIWIANHFGSRGLGHTIASGFFAAAAGLDMTDRVPDCEGAPVLFDIDSYLGEFYIEAMKLAGAYAYAGRDYVIQQVLDILQTQATFEVHNHHNYAWLEDGLWVVRKGATPLTREPAFIGGSMGEASAIVRGVEGRRYVDRGAEGGDSVPSGKVADVGSLGSAPHGAGRQMSRTQAAGKLRKMWVCTERDCGFQERAFAEHDPPEHGHKMRKVRMRDKSTAAIDWDVERAKLNDLGIVVLGAGADEAPGAYKSLREVLDHHENIEILHTLSPIGVVMASPDEFDPYKD